MDFPLVSVIIPAYNGEDHLGEAIQSVLDQTYPYFELIVVDDASQDDSSELIGQFDDARLQYIVHGQNRGADYARHTGFQASTGEIIAYLDQDDIYHPEKLSLHVDYLRANPDVGFTFNAYFNLNHSSTTIRNISQPPQFITLADLILGFPLPPSVWVIRRQWASREELWDESTFLQGSEIITCSRLFMAGCKFARVDRVLNYRRYHAGRTFNNLTAKCETEISCQRMVFADPRCPEDILALREIAFANIYLLWTYVAFVQEETDLGLEFVNKAVNLKPNLIQGEPSELTKFFLIYSIDEEKASHEKILRRIFAQFPPGLTQISNQCKWAIAQGYLIKGVRAVTWGRANDGRRHFDQALRLEAQLDEPTLQSIIAQLLDFENEFGSEAAEMVLQKLRPYMEQIDNPNSVQLLKGSYSVSRAFRNYQAGKYKQVPRDIIRAMISDPKYLTNRGLLSILLHSIISIWT